MGSRGVAPSAHWSSLAWISGATMEVRIARQGARGRVADANSGSVRAWSVDSRARQTYERFLLRRRNCLIGLVVRLERPGVLADVDLHHGARG